MMTTKMIEVRRLLPDDIFVVDGEVYEVGKIEVAIEPLGSWSTNAAGEWVGAAPQQVPRVVLICQTQRWTGFLFPITGEWIRIEDNVLVDFGTLPKEVKLVDPDWEKNSDNKPH